MIDQDSEAPTRSRTRLIKAAHFIWGPIVLLLHHFGPRPDGGFRASHPDIADAAVLTAAGLSLAAAVVIAVSDFDPDRSVRHRRIMNVITYLELGFMMVFIGLQ